MNPYRHFIGEIGASRPAGGRRIAGRARFLRHHGRAAARYRRTATSPPTPPWCWPRPRKKKPRDIAERAAGAPQGQSRRGRRRGRGTGLHQPQAHRCLLARAAARVPEGGDRLRRFDDGRGREGQCRVRLGQPDRPAARGACARRGGGRCARQPAGQGGLRRHQGVLHQRRRRAGRHARPLDLPALQGGAGRADRHDPRRPLSRRVPEGGRRGDRQARRRALDRQARGRLAADDARLRHRLPDGRDQDRPRDHGRPHRRLFVGARAGRGRRGRSRLPGAGAPGPDLHGPARSAQGQEARRLGGSRADPVPGHQVRRRRRPAAQEVGRHAGPTSPTTSPTTTTSSAAASPT